jgi:hypothetical protein
MSRFSDVDLASVDALRERIMDRRSTTVSHAAQAFVEDLASTFSSVVLARMFLVVPLSSLPAGERSVATLAANGDARLRPQTRVLSLVGTYGREPGWQSRALSRGHGAIPLLDTAHVQAVPMIARLLADLQVDLAETALDAWGRYIIPARDFVTQYGVRTVFGMGGSYLDGTLAVAVVFTDELVPVTIVDQLAGLISNFKMSTSWHATEGRIYA